MQQLIEGGSVFLHCRLLPGVHRCQDFFLRFRIGHRSRQKRGRQKDTDPYLHRLIAYSRFWRGGVTVEIIYFWCLFSSRYPIWNTSLKRPKPTDREACGECIHQPFVGGHKRRIRSDSKRNIRAVVDGSIECRSDGKGILQQW